MFRSANYSRRRQQLSSSNSRLNFELLEAKRVLAANFVGFSVFDASQDLSTNTVFESGALSLDFAVELDNGSELQAVEVFAKEGSDVVKLGEFFSAAESDALVSLEGFFDFSGSHEIYGVVSTTDGQHAISSPVDIEVLATTTEFGNHRGTDFNFVGGADSAYVLQASGGTDTLNLNFDQADVANFNGLSLEAYDRDAFVTTQAFYQGSAYDFLVTEDGQELYFQGVERLEFADGSIVPLHTLPNDPEYVEQWDISTGDVGDAWRFTRGSEEVLLVSLDTGVPSTNGNPTTSDIDQSRTDYIIPDNVSLNDGDHGHRATSVIVAEPNNGFGLTGINWESPTLIIDVYSNNNPGITPQRLTNAIQASLDYLETSSASRIVFQGGIQGEFWLNVLDQSLISANLDSTLYSVAAGNGSVDLNDNVSNNVFSAGVARLAGTYSNVLAIGALEPTFEYVDGIKNSVNLPLAGYSNYGDDLSFAAPSRTRSIGPTGSVRNFGGTSNANPVVAAYSSLVWSVDPTLTATEVRDILAETAIDLGVDGRDPQFGHGTPDAGAAVRRAWALTENAAVSNLEANPFASDPGIGYALISSEGVGENVDTSSGNFDVGFLTTTFDNSNSYTYNLVTGSGDADNALFEIGAGNALELKQGTTVDYEARTSYSIHVEVSDGVTTQDQELIISVIDDAETTSFVLANGEAQRSNLDQFVVEFDGIVTLGSSAFELVRRGPDGGSVDVTASIDDSSGFSVATLTFGGDFVEDSGSLVDGNYELTLFGDQITTASGQSFDGDGDGLAGGNQVFGDTEADNFFRHFGDINGDRLVNVVDLLAFRDVWLTDEDDQNFHPDFDSNGDGTINVIDLLRFRNNWLSESEFV